LFDAHFFSSIPKEIFVFIVGGVTFEEAAYVAQLNSSTPNCRIVLGGSSILNSQSFLEEVSSEFQKPSKSRDFVALEMD